MSSISGIGSTPTPPVTNTQSNTSGNTGTAGTTAGTTTGTGSSTSGSGSNSGSGGISGTGLLSSLGIGSGLDVSSIIDALVNAKKAGPQQQIDNQSAKDTALVTGLTGLKSALSSLTSSLDKLSSSDTYTQFNSTLADTSIASASTLPYAVPGSYSVDVQSLATAQKRLSPSYPADGAVGSGSLTISVGGKTLDVPVSAAGDSIGDIANNINAAAASAGDVGISAAVVNGANGSQLVLTSTKTGVANGFSVSASGTSDSGLKNLASALDTAGSQEATDAQLSIDGVAVTSASNTVTGALTGVTLNLTATGSSELTVSQNTDTITSAVKDFVSAYNSYAQTAATLSSYDKQTGKSGILLGDSTLSSIQRQISSVLGSAVSNNSIGSLANLGLTRNPDGSIALDDAKLGKALSANPAAVRGLFSGDQGVASRLDTALKSYTGLGGQLDTRINSLNQDIKGLKSKSDDLDARMNVYAQQLQKQYTALDALVSSLNNTSSYLQQLDAVNNNSNKNN